MRTGMALPDPEEGRRYKTGMRVKFTGYYRDQFGLVSWHVQYGTFPPAIGRKNQCAYRRFLGDFG